MLKEGSVVEYVHSLIDSGGIRFYSDHLDLWSMGDSFERFIRPKSRVRFFAHGSFQLYAIRCDLLRTPPASRDDEEYLLRTLLRGARAFSKHSDSAPFLFVLRQVFNLFQETSPSAKGKHRQGQQRLDVDSALAQRANGN